MTQVNFVAVVPALGLSTYHLEQTEGEEPCSVSTVSYYNLDASIDDEYVPSKLRRFVVPP